MVQRADGVGKIVVTALVVLLTTWFPLAASLRAQTAAGIIGQLTDESAAVLPGVTVTATSSALQVPSVSAVTNERGEYRLTPLPIGTYDITFDLAGFQAVKREGVRLTQGFVAKLDIVLKVGSLEETVTVSGASPIVDVTSTAGSTQLTRETLEAVPTSRNGVLSLAEQTPGVRANLDIGGTATVAIPAFRAFAQSGEMWLTLDGIVISNLSDGANGAYIDYSAMEEARIDTIANDAEMPRRGIRIQSLVKSGSNEYHGSGFWGQTRPGLQSNNLDAALAAVGVKGQNKVTNRVDVSGDLGGKLVQDKLWFYEALRGRGIDEQVPGAFQPDGSAALHTQRQYFTTTKISYQPSPRHRFVGLYQWNQKEEVGLNLNTLTDYEARNDQLFHNNVGKVEWQATRGNSLTMGAQFGVFRQRAPWVGHSKTPPSTDNATVKVWGDSTNDGFRYGQFIYNTKATLGWYKSDLFYGSHEFKFGFDYLDDSQGSAYLALPTGNYRLIFNNGAPFQVQTYNRPVHPLNVVHFPGFYAKDSWAVTHRLTFNLGLRYDRSAGFTPAQCREAGTFAAAQCFDNVELKVWNPLAPRIHAAYDLRGNGKTVIKGGWGRYNHIRTITPEVDSTNRNVAQTITWRWHDNNGNGAYDPGEVNLDPNGADFVSIAGGTNGVLNPNEKEPKTDEFSASLERELIPNFALRVTGIYSQTSNTYMIANIARTFDTFNIPVTRPDPGPDGRVGSADDPGANFTYYEYSTALRGLQFSTTQPINPPGATQTYRSVEVAASKRLSNRWALMASYSATRKHIPLGTGTSSWDPNTEFNLADNTWEWTAKASGTYLFPYGILTSINFEQRSGDTYARQVLFTGGQTIPSVVLNVEPLGTRRQPNLNLLDFRAEKRFTLASSKRLIVRFNVFNLPNANTAVTINRQSSATFEYPTSILPPRVGEFSVSYQF
jgi:hypothetical protein